MSDYADNLRKSIINAGKKFTEMVEEVRRKQNEADREEIIRMAREAGFEALLPHEHINGTGSVYVGDENISGMLEQFANLVAAAEREACAKLCEQTTAAWTQHLYNEGVMDCVQAIRARGKE